MKNQKHQNLPEILEPCFFKLELSSPSAFKWNSLFLSETSLFKHLVVSWASLIGQPKGAEELWELDLLSMLVPLLLLLDSVTESLLVDSAPSLFLLFTDTPSIKTTKSRKIIIPNCKKMGSADFFPLVKWVYRMPSKIQLQRSIFYSSWMVNKECDKKIKKMLRFWVLSLLQHKLFPDTMILFSVTLSFLSVCLRGDRETGVWFNTTAKCQRGQHLFLNFGSLVQYNEGMNI